MKHLKNYKLFESRDFFYPDSDDLIEVKSTLNDIFLDALDVDIPVYLSAELVHDYRHSYQCVWVQLGDDSDNDYERYHGKIENYIDDIRAANEYLKGEEFNIIIRQMQMNVAKFNSKSKNITPIVFTSFDDFLKEVERLKVYNDKHKRKCYITELKIKYTR